MKLRKTNPPLAEKLFKFSRLAVFAGENYGTLSTFKLI
jgi:hypothetical protein